MFTTTQAFLISFSISMMLPLLRAYFKSKGTMKEDVPLSIEVLV